jgi:predicted HAD superfamily phosphohydrolase YqeG
MWAYAQPQPPNIKGRVPKYDLGSHDEVIGFVESGVGEKVIICDVDNTLAPQGVPLGEFALVVNDAIDRLEAHKNVARVIALTNGPEREVSRLVSRGNKPWTSRRRLGLRSSRTPIVVVGDQVLTDGVLAWRLRATFLHLVIDDEDEARRQATMRRLGSHLIGVLFRRTAMTGLATSEEPW